MRSGRKRSAPSSEKKGGEGEKHGVVVRTKGWVFALRGWKREAVVINVSLLPTLLLSSGACA